MAPVDKARDDLPRDDADRRRAEKGARLRRAEVQPGFGLAVDEKPHLEQCRAPPEDREREDDGVESVVATGHAVGAGHIANRVDCVKRAIELFLGVNCVARHEAKGGKYN